MSYLEIKNISFGYSKNEPLILDNFSLTIERKSIVSVNGPSGCGKSTLLRIIAGLEKISTGTISIDGKIVTAENIFCEPQHRQVGMVFQDYALFPHMTVFKNVIFGINKLKKKDRKKRGEEMLDMVGLGNFHERYPHELSGGEQQRVAIARAMAPEPKILLLDEPFSNLDEALRIRILTEIRDILKNREITALFVTHNMEESRLFSDKEIIM
ncbi:MAG: ABC transporter [Deltaproteobacteria bacterium]|nr:MAG: ABC transporter [Deltaproteobacteria bacterium]